MMWCYCVLMFAHATLNISRLMTLKQQAASPRAMLLKGAFDEEVFHPSALGVAKVR